MPDFDFLVGTWDVAGRRLRERLVSSATWDEFPARSQCWRLFDGQANVDHIVFPTFGLAGMTVRLFDPVQRHWSLHWASSHTGRFEPPVVGRFVDGIGEFYGDDTHEGIPVRVRYRWSGITPETAHWEQAFSVDGEQTWETNFVMDFTRVGS